MDYSDPAQRYKKGMGNSDRINFAFELEQEIKENKDELALLQQTGADARRIKELEERIAEREKLHLKVQEDIHGVKL